MFRPLIKWHLGEKKELCSYKISRCMSCGIIITVELALVFILQYLCGQILYRKTLNPGNCEEPFKIVFVLSHKLTK